ncbi:MAG: penicillin acylase family protein [Myxococcales bacterium]|nr:penicillin acylase family protein [Myxococcales bacterium]MBP6848049.1 penicillin acylase family protein [Kofleriaceae bacterium]
MRTLLCLAAVAACSTPPARPAAPPTPPAPAPRPHYHATIRWTDHGVPHIVAADVGGLGFGQGYAQAQAHLCELADGFVRVRGERARYLGRGPDDAHLKSDLVHRHLGYLARAKAALPTASAETRAMVAGFAAGYSYALARMPAAAQPAACRGAAWLQPITDVDVAAYGLSIQAIASSRFFADAIAEARPEPKAAPAAPTPAPATGGASNGWAIGGDRTATGGGVLIGNPHFPWQGDLLFHEAHLTIPGDLDVYGVSLLGTPAIQIGTTARHAWTHTFSASTHQVIYRLDLAPDSVMRYRHGEETLPITATHHAIGVRGDDGAVHDEDVVAYRSAIGPMIAVAASPWSAATGHAFTLRDVAAGSVLALDQYLAMARAGSRAAFEAALAMHGTPFVNTLYADVEGDALYVDGSRVPDLSDDALGRWKLVRKLMAPVDAAWREQRLVILDGSDPINDLAADDPHAPGAVPFASVPRILRRDYVMNANDSYQHTNPAAPEALAPRSPLWGDDGDRPSARTLANLAALAPGGGAAGPDDRFTLDEAAAAMLSNQSFVAARLGDEVRAACAAKPAGEAAAVIAQLKRGCAALAAWDGRFAVDSRGAALWRELMRALAAGGPVPWARPYDRQAPRLTPDGLARDTAAVRAAIAAATAALADAKLAPDVALGDVQRAAGPQGPVAVPGGRELDGVANVVTSNRFDATALPEAPVDARYPVDFGSSFILAVELTPAGRTVKALLTYGNSSDPASPWYRDQLAAFAQGALRPVPLTDAAIAADPAYRLEELDAP